MKRWKIALSLAVAASIAVPGLGGTWRLAPAHWVDLTDSQKQRIANELKQTDNCRHFSDEGEYTRLVRLSGMKELADGGVYYPAQRATPEYFMKLFLQSIGAFGLTFAFAMIGPPIWRQYLAWLRR
jgi:hypothetical protein